MHSWCKIIMILNWKRNLKFIQLRRSRLLQWNVRLCQVIWIDETATSRQWKRWLFSSSSFTFLSFKIKSFFFMTTFHFISFLRFRLENKLSRFRLTMLFSFLDSVSLVSRTFFFNFFFNFFFQSDFIFLGCVFPLHHFSLTFASSPSSSSSWKHIWLKLVDRK